jgi:3'-5' exoribonuclease
VQDADDPGRPLVRRALQPEPLHEPRVRRQAGDRHRVRVRHVGQQRAHRHHHLAPERLGEVDDELDGFLEHLAREVHHAGFRALLEALLGDDVLRAAWRRAPCTRSGHHAYLGGLLEHTVAVATLAQEACILHQRLDSDLLLTAAIVHDLGKTREFTYGAEIGLSDEGRLLGHVELGLRLLDERAAQIPSLDAERRLALAHCVLTHHGPDAAPARRFGSPEALALHRLNALDASVKGALEHGLP